MLKKIKNLRQYVCLNLHVWPEIFVNLSKSAHGKVSGNLIRGLEYFRQYSRNNVMMHINYIEANSAIYILSDSINTYQINKNPERKKIILVINRGRNFNDESKR
jgi:hypothetical protein